MNKTALFGGTFDPIHRGHINLATEAVRECELNQLIFLPNYISPFKRDSNVTPGEMRAEMIRRILPLNSAFSISEYELERQEPSYSYDTLRYFRERMPDAEISFIIGFDSVLTIEKWYRGPDLLREFPLITGVRPHVSTEEGLEKIEYFRKRYHSRFHVLNLKPFDASSTEIREYVRKGKDISGLVVPEVEEYIRNNGIYFDGIDE